MGGAAAHLLQPSCPKGSPISGSLRVRDQPQAPHPVPVATTRQQRRSYNSPHFAAWPMTSEQAAQLIDDTLDLVHQRLQELEAAQHQRDQKALAAEFREWRQPLGGHIDLMVCPGFPAV